MSIYRYAFFTFHWHNSFSDRKRCSKFRFSWKGYFTPDCVYKAHTQRIKLTANLRVCWWCGRQAGVRQRLAGWVSSNCVCMCMCGVVWCYRAQKRDSPQKALGHLLSPSSWADFSSVKRNPIWSGGGSWLLLREFHRDCSWNWRSL